MTPDYRTALLVTARALPPGTAVPVTRETLIELLSATTAAEAPDLVADRWLTATEVGKLLGTPERWVYNHADELGGKHLSRRCLRFPESAVRRRLERRG